jgi:hypothetical protein
MYTTVLTEADVLLRREFEDKTLRNEAFRHREHVRLTWIYLTSDSPDGVAARLCASLLALATSHGVSHRFHHTLTVAWVRIIESARREHPDVPFDVLAEGCPFLLDKDTPLTYYSRDILFSDEARQRWVEPDLRALPAV